MAKITNGNVAGVDVRTSNTAEERNRLGLPSERDLTQWLLEYKTAHEANVANVQMNEANNLLQQRLADQAYERSTAKNQLAELMAAGLTEQQARQAIAGTGEGATAFPVATTQPGHVAPPSFSPSSPSENGLANAALSGSMSMVGDLFGILGNSLTSEDGGPIGWALASDYMTELTSLVDKGYIQPDDMCLPADLVMFGNSMQDGEAKDAILRVAHGKNAYRVASHPLAMKGAQKWLGGNFGFKTERQHIAESYARTMLQQKNLQYVETQITAQNLENINTELGVQKNVLLFDTDLNVCYKNLQNALMIANRDYDINKRTYKLFVENAIKDVENQKALLDLTDKMISIRSKIADGSLAGLSDDVSLIQGYFLSAKESGLLNSSIIGALLSSTLAVGNEGTQILQRLFDNLKTLENKTLEKNDKGFKNPFTAPPHQTRVTETWRSIL